MQNPPFRRFILLRVKLRTIVLYFIKLMRTKKGTASRFLAKSGPEGSEITYNLFWRFRRLDGLAAGTCYEVTLLTASKGAFFLAASSLLLAVAGAPRLLIFMVFSPKSAPLGRSFVQWYTQRRGFPRKRVRSRR